MNRKYRESGKPFQTKQTGSVAKWMGMSDEGVRLYERYELIHPEKDKQNKYRAFDIMDVTMLLYGMVYRESGFTMKEAQNLANYCSLNEIHEAFLEKAEQRRRELERELLVIGRMKEISKEIEQVRNSYGICSVEERPALYRLEFMDRGIILEESEKQRYASQWMKNNLPFVMLSTRYYADTLDAPQGQIKARTGFGVYARYAEDLNIKEDENVKYYPPVRSIHTILSANNEMLSPDYTGVLQYIKENGLCICGDAISFGIANLHFKDTFDRYFHLWIPIKDKEESVSAR